MTSKEALEKIANCKFDLGFDVDCEPPQHCGYLCLGLCYQDEIEVIKQDLERLEKINEVWHKNEPMESVDINGNHLQELYDFIHRICEENEKLKKAIDSLKDNIYFTFDDECTYICFQRDVDD